MKKGLLILIIGISLVYLSGCGSKNHIPSEVHKDFLVPSNAVKLTDYFFTNKKLAKSVKYKISGADRPKSYFNSAKYIEYLEKKGWKEIDREGSMKIYYNGKETVWLELNEEDVIISLLK
jgi:predicted RNA binding protein YcfA (HicA-like mRNA interferase family)